MEIIRINIKPQSEIEKHEAFKQALFHCPVCEGMMEFQTTRLYGENQLMEEAHCPACQVQIRVDLHTEH